jgi:hypothetical protein
VHLLVCDNKCVCVFYAVNLSNVKYIVSSLFVLGASENCEKRLLAASCLSACLSVCQPALHNPAPTGQIFVTEYLSMFRDIGYPRIFRDIGYLRIFRDIGYLRIFRDRISEDIS